MTTTLDLLKPGERGRVEALAGADDLVQRLYELGVVEGEIVEVVALAPLGDPVEIRLGNSRLSLRRSEAAGITVTHAG